MKAKHGNIFVSKVPKSNLEILFESWQEYTSQNFLKENDRAKNITYNFPELGRVIISYEAGSITIYTDYNIEYVQKFFKRLMGKNAFRLFKEYLTYRQFGAHFVKYRGAIGYQIDIKKPCTMSVWLIAKKCKNYGDLHCSFKFPLDAVTIKDFSRKSIPMATIPTASKEYKKDSEIIEYGKRKGGFLCLEDAKELGMDRSSLCKRLKKYKKLGIIKKICKYPVEYVLK